jgi:hypothetical protein
MELLVSDPYAQPPGQPDPYGSQQPPAQPNQYGSAQPPAQPDPSAVPQPLAQPNPYGSPQPPVSPAAPAQQGYPQPYSVSGQPQYGAAPTYAPGGVQPPAKSKKGLIIGLVVGGLVLLMILCGVGAALALNSADDEDPVTPTPGSSTSAAAPATSKAAPQNNNAVTADSSSDFEDVCQKGSILNAADYSGPAGAKAYVFSNSPERTTSWSSKSLDSRASYYAKSTEYATVSVVGCLAYEEGSEAPGQKCEVKASDGTKVTVDYTSLRYTLTFYAAKTGEKIGDGGTINAPANKCPGFLTYNKTTLKSYASPDSGAIDAAVKKMLTA